ALDPHSNYLSHDVLEDFQISMELSLDGIGVALSSRDGYSVVEKVIPGGAADGLDVLEPKDKIIAVAQDGEEPVDIIDMDLRDVVRLIRGKRGTKVHLTILRQAETTERFRVSIVRDKISLEEQAAKLRFEDVVIEGEKKKIAILELPSFYGGRNPGERQSSNDVEKLLEKARKAKADGLILDLSRNGGGLLENSVEITGFFIKKGGVVAVKDTFSKVQVLKDRDANILWDLPMVVLTSRVSASASEIVAGALKDYRRAVIVGDGHTFGKGTVQSMVPLPEGLGALKVTTALFFRPGGKSTQHEGVHSDVVVPSIFGTDDFGEMHQTYSLPSQSIDAFVDDDDVPSLDSSQDGAPWVAVTPEILAELSRRSAARVAEDQDLIDVQERIAKAEERNGVVHLEELMKEQAEEEQEEIAKNGGSETEGAEENPESSSADTASDDSEVLSAQQLEAIRILSDLIQLTS
ncbi:MAG: tail-specific protease, partial [Deltaproteobacteria bacterium]|nr:tail-specific protease [Deltaproteobacteria bacterium]